MESRSPRLGTAPSGMALSGTAPSTAPRTSNAEWLRVLDDLEASLGSGLRDSVLSAQGGQLITGVQWRAPEHLGQLPRELEARARQLLAGQLELIREIEDARRSAGAHLAAVRTILATHLSDQPVYLDIAG